MGAVAGGSETHLSQFLIFLAFCFAISLGFTLRWVGLPRSASLVLLGCFVVAFFSVQSILHPIFPRNHITNFTGRGPLIVEGQVLAPLDPGLERTYLTIEVLAITNHDQRPTRVCGRMRVTIYGPYSQTVFVGDRIRFVSSVYSIRPCANPHAFDYRRFLALKRIYASATLGSFSNIVVLEDGGRKSWPGLVDRLRQRLNRWIGVSVPEPYNALASALLIGYRGRIPDALQEIFRRCGTSHLIAISGLHLGIVAVLLFVVIKWLLGLFPRIFLYVDVQRITAVLTFWLLLFYLLLTGSRISTLRAFIMAATYLAVLFFRRTTRLEDILVLAAFILLLFQPQAVFESSFQLTFVAVGGILLGVRQGLHDAASKVDREGIIKKGFRWFRVTAWVTFLAIAVTFPVLGYHFHRVSPMGILANLFGVPFVSFIILPVGMASLSVFSVSTTLATYLIRLDGRFIAILVDVFRRLSYLSFSQIHVFPFKWYEIVLYYLAFIFALLMLRSGNKKERQRNGTVAVISILLLGMIVGFSWLGGSGMSMEIFSVKRGTYLAIYRKGGHATLICNGLGDSPNRDDARWVLVPYLLNKRVRRIDAIVVANNQPVNLRSVTTLLAFKNTECLAGTPSVLYSLRRMLPSKIPDAKWLETPGIVQMGGLEVRLPGESFHKLPDSPRAYHHKEKLPGIVLSYLSLKAYISLSRGREPLFEKGNHFNLLLTANPEKSLNYFPAQAGQHLIVRYPGEKRWWKRKIDVKNLVDLRSDGAVELQEVKGGWCLRTFLSRRTIMLRPSQVF